MTIGRHRNSEQEKVMARVTGKCGSSFEISVWSLAE